MPPNLFDDADSPDTGERFETLARVRQVTIERIVSSATPDVTRYVQEHDEWVALLRGEATLEIDGVARELRAGDHVLLPARTPHIVRRTSAGAVWLAVHVGP
jgi:cupin 2 domain-containing protein